MVCTVRTEKQTRPVHSFCDGRYVTFCCVINFSRWTVCFGTL